MVSAVELIRSVCLVMALLAACAWLLGTVFGRLVVWNIKREERRHAHDGRRHRRPALEGATSGEEREL